MDFCGGVAVMVVWFFVGALCKRPWRWKRLNVLLQLTLCLVVAMPRFFAGQAPAPQCKEKYLLTILSFYSLRSPFGPAFRLLTLVGRLARSHANPCRFQP